VEAVREEEVRLGVGFVKEVGFKPGVKEGFIDVESGKSEYVTGEGISESEMEELVPEWGWQRELIPETRCSTAKGTMLFLDMMKVAEQE